MKRREIRGHRQDDLQHRGEGEDDSRGDRGEARETDNLQRRHRGSLQGRAGFHRGDHGRVVERYLSEAGDSDHQWEEASHVRARAPRFVERLEAKEGNILVVYHGLFLSIILSRYFGQAPADLWKNLTFGHTLEVDFEKMKSSTRVGDRTPVSFLAGPYKVEASQHISMLNENTILMPEHPEKGSTSLLEVLSIAVMIVALFLFKPEYVWVYELVALLYIFLERRLRRRPWEELGIKDRGILADLKSNVPIVVLVSFFVQPAVVFGSYLFYPPLLFRLEERVSYLRTHVGPQTPLLLFLLFVALATLVEELIFRGLIQERTAWFTNEPTGVLLGSLTMSLIHFSPGDPTATVLDLLLVFIDSVLYGLIYVRTRDIAASWMAHLLADYVGLSLLWFI